MPIGTLKNSTVRFSVASDLSNSEIARKTGARDSYLTPAAFYWQNDHMAGVRESDEVVAIFRGYKQFIHQMEASGLGVRIEESAV